MSHLINTLATLSPNLMVIFWVAIMALALIACVAAASAAYLANFTRKQAKWDFLLLVSWAGLLLISIGCAIGVHFIVECAVKLSEIQP